MEEARGELAADHSVATPSLASHSISLSENTADSDSKMETQDAPAEEEALNITFTHAGTAHTASLPTSASLLDLASYINDTLGIPPENQKFLINPKPGLLKPPFSQDLALAPLASRRITLLGAKPSKIAAINANLRAVDTRRRTPGPIKAATPAVRRDWKKIQDASTYTFLAMRPLMYLPHPERSAAFLAKLRDDPGIRASMIRHKWTVALLTEMDPVAHTTVEGTRTLGLNRNRGEVIELRLRTDAGDGYRDYKTIRKTLCHELAHNVHGPHDSAFWALCHEIEREVERDDWTRGGRTVGHEEYSIPAGEEHEVADHGGWSGGEYVLGSGRSGVGGSNINSNGAPLTRRQILAKAADERAKRLAGRPPPSKKPDHDSNAN